MALSRQVTPTRHLNAFMRWCAAAGYRVGEHPDYGGVTAGVHAPESWHYERGATDINWGVGNPPGERAHLLAAFEVAESMGLAITFARDGVQGSAARHQHHLHAEVGEWSNYGTGPVRRVPGGLRVYDMQGIVFDAGAQRDNLWRANTDKRLRAVRLASEFHGPRFPYGHKYVQRVIGVDDDGAWGPVSRTAHDVAVGGIQDVIDVAADGVWGPITDAAFLRTRKAYLR